MPAVALLLVTLLAPELAGPGAPSPRLGAALALDGDLLAVGAPHTGRGAHLAGAVATWRHDGATWRRAGLLLGDGRAGERFGSALDLDGSTLVVGAYFADGPQPRTGAVHVYEEGALERGGVQLGGATARLVPPDAGELDGFGWSVSLDGERLLVGAPFADRAGFQSGEARVYVRVGGSWWLQDALLPTGLAAFDHLGWSVAWCQGRALVGAPDSDLAGPGRGAVFVFEWSGTAWEERPPLLAPDLPPGAGLGTALAATGSRVLAGAPWADSARFWRRRAGGWEVEATLAGTPSSRFGAAVAVLGEEAAVGGPAGSRVWRYRRRARAWLPHGELAGGRRAELGRALGLGTGPGRGPGKGAGHPLAVGAPGEGGGRVEVWD